MHQSRGAVTPIPSKGCLREDVMERMPETRATGHRRLVDRGLPMGNTPSMGGCSRERMSCASSCGNVGSFRRRGQVEGPGAFREWH